MQQYDILIALDRIQRLAKARQTATCDQMRQLLYRQLDEAMQELLSHIPHEYDNMRSVMIVVSTSVIEHRPSHIVDTLHPFFCALMGGEGSGRILHEIQWHLLERRPPLGAPELRCIKGGLS
jgi:hypothetical protein